MNIRQATISVEPEEVKSEFQTGEQRLAAGVLDDAVDCYRKGGRRRREVQQWVKRPFDGPFSFLGVCHFLNLDPAYVRQLFQHLSDTDKGENPDD